VVAHLQEAISGMRILRLLGCEDEQVRHLESLTRSEVNRNLSVIRLQTGILPLCSALAHMGTAAVIWFGGSAVCRGEMSVGDLIAYLVLFERAVQRTLVVAGVLNTIHAGRGALTRTEALLETGKWSEATSRASGLPVLLCRDASVHSAVPECSLSNVIARSEETKQPKTSGLQFGEMRIRDLTFAYPGTSEPVLKGIDITARAGEIIAVTSRFGQNCFSSGASGALSLDERTA